MHILGDLHGEFNYLKRLDGMLWAEGEDIHPERATDRQVLILGDIGIGFPGENDLGFTPLCDTYVIRGNHDDYDVIKNMNAKNVTFIDDGTIRPVRDLITGEEHNALFIGGAVSIDRQWRTPGLDWWHTEEVTQNRFEEILEIVEATEGIRYVFTHDAPEYLYPGLGIHYVYPNRTTRYLELIANMLRGNDVKWFFGHHHKAFTFHDQDRDIQFRCRLPVVNCVPEYFNFKII